LLFLLKKRFKLFKKDSQAGLIILLKKANLKYNQQVKKAF